MLSRFLAGVACLITAGVLAACGGGGTSNAPKTTPAATATANAADANTPTQGGYVAKMKALTIPASLAKGRKLGDDAAKVKLEVFEDFRCIHCLEFTSDFEQFIVDSYVTPGKVQIQFRYFPLSQASLPMMVAAECANQQEQFWPYAKKLFLVQAESYEGGPPLAEAFTEAKLKTYADELKLDAAAFAACLATSAPLDAVAADYREVQALSLKGTPAFVINGKLLTENPANRAAWRAVLDAAAK